MSSTYVSRPHLAVGMRLSDRQWELMKYFFGTEEIDGDGCGPARLHHVRERSDSMARKLHATILGGLELGVATDAPRSAFGEKLWLT